MTTFIHSGSAFAQNLIGSPGAELVSGRLTVSPTDPVPVADIAASDLLYFLPYKGNQVPVFNGTNWVFVTIPPAGVQFNAVTGTPFGGGGPGLAANTVYDVFLFSAAGTPTLELVAWATQNARAIALAVLDGVYVRSTDTTRLYLGTVRTEVSAPGRFNDAPDGRYVWNYWNRVKRRNTAISAAASWTNGVNNWSPIQGGVVEFIHPIVIGVSEDAVRCDVRSACNADTDGGQRKFGSVQIGVNSTTTPHAEATGGSAQLLVGGGGTAIQIFVMEAMYDSLPGIGLQTFYGLEVGFSIAPAPSYQRDITDPLYNTPTTIAGMTTTWWG